MTRALRRPGTALVTGAARGIGLAIASRLLAAGWRVGMVDVDGEAVHGAAAGLAGATRPGHLDVRDPEQWRAVLAGLCGGGPLDLLVNNAGILASGPFSGMPPETHRRIVEVNLLGVLNGCREAHPFLRRSDRALVLNLASASALYGQPALATYGATKAAVKSLTEALDIEWRADRIRVRSLLPLFVATDMVAKDAQDAASVGRLGVRLTAEDVADAAERVLAERWSLLRSPHRAVGRQTRLFAAASSVSPHWAQRLVVRRIAG
jgi:NAD(P)-dependent dehydrogenase (short-subunit alcohol dehydrogenase family)